MSAVVALPTAAPKKVRQQPSRTRAADRKALLRFPDVYKSAWQRERDARKAERMALAVQADLSSLFLIVKAMATTMSRADQRRIWMSLAFAAEHTGGPEAHAWWEQFIVDPNHSWKGDE